ncbi:MAG: hypothetical protein CVV60_00835 [Tenericutes bacterium HGW-Tenericutes-5]|nr:MAG: hypothetical protein CVV60_00835 [Tenericutes bacterium HGW-Tenericutes-5]
MNFKVGIAQYVLGNYTSKDLPKLALDSLESGMEAPSLLILAGLVDGWEIENYLRLTLKELKLSLPSEKEAGLEVIEYYLNKIINNESDPEEEIKNIIDQVLNKVNYSHQNEKYAYEYISFDKIYGLYWAIDDFKNPLVSVITSREKGVLKCKNKIIVESKKLLSEFHNVRERILNF